MTQASQYVAGYRGGFARVRRAGAFAPPTGPDAAGGASSGEVPIAAAAACLSCLAGGWIAAGSVGMLDDALRHALMWSALALAVFADRVFRPGRARPALVLIAGGAAVVAMGASRLSELNVLAAALAAALLAPSRDVPARRALVTVSQALVVLAVWRLLVGSVPVLWVAADRLGWLLGLAGSAGADHPLWTGATFGGVDFLVTMLALLASHLPAMRRRRVSRGLLILAAMAAGHLLYLVVLAFCPRIVSALPDTASRGWDWAPAVRALVPWHVPALAAAIDLAIAAAMIRWSAWPTEADGQGPGTPARAAVEEATLYVVAENKAGEFIAARPEPTTPHGVATNGTTPHGVATNGARRLRHAGLAAAVVVAAALPFAATFSPGPCSLAGKKVVALARAPTASSQPGGPVRAGAESFGMLGGLVEGLGGRWAVSAGASQGELAGADVVVVEANRPWGVDEMEPIGNFIRHGGSLLLAGVTRTWDERQPTAVPQSMKVFDTVAVPAAPDWAGCVEAMSHPATVGIAGDGLARTRGRWFDVEPPSRPLLVCRWCWADQPAINFGESTNGKYDAGEKLGDLVFAGEFEFGNGTVVALADGAALGDAALVRSHAFAGRLLGYLAARPAGHGAMWRQVISLAAGAFLAMLLLGRAGAFRPAAVAIILAGGLWASTQATGLRCQPLPDGRGRNWNNLAYIDQSHLGDFSSFAGQPASLDELALALMRSSMVVMSMDRFDPARLERAGMFITVAPRRAFTVGERRGLSSFVRKGGVFICLAGWQQRGAVADLLADFGLAVGDTPPPAGAADTPMPQPLGRIGLSYLPDGENPATRPGDKPGKSRRAGVHFQSAWPVAAGGPRTQTLVRARRDKAVVVMTRIGEGKVVLIGDPAFAANRNLEIEARPGKPNEANRQNAEFWRWLLARVREPWEGGSGMGKTPMPLMGKTPMPQADANRPGEARP